MSETANQNDVRTTAIIGGLLLIAASILWVGYGLSFLISEAGAEVYGGITFLNAAMFYLMGMGCLRKVHNETRK